MDLESKSLPITERILRSIKEQEDRTGIKRTLLAVCPNSNAVIKAALHAAKRCNAPLKFAATLNQVDTDRGYTGLTQKDFVETIKLESIRINLTSPVIIAIDHGGPWLKDEHRSLGFTYNQTMSGVKKSFEAAIDAGYHLIHVDPTIDISLKYGEIIPIETVAERTIELISHSEAYRRAKKMPPISYEVGTEEVHGGLADLKTFKKFLELLKKGLAENNLADTWPCFIVGKVGTDLHTPYFDASIARQLTNIAKEYGSQIKGHYSDNVDNPQDYPLAGMGAANVGPEFTECEYNGLMELVNIEEKLAENNSTIVLSNLKNALWEAVIFSGRWKKWLQEGESASDFYSITNHRQEWLIKTGCRYIWQNLKVVDARAALYENLSENDISAEEIVSSHIERAIDRYFHAFNLVDFNKYL